MAFVQKGLKNILQKTPNDVVFLSALRTPVTRAKKGGLRDAYDHELLGAVRYPQDLQDTTLDTDGIAGAQSHNYKISKPRPCKNK